MLFFVVVIGLSLILWLPSKEGSKSADLGAAILSGGIVGIAVQFVGQAFRSVAEQGQTFQAMQLLPASPAPARDDFEAVTTAAAPAPDGPVAPATAPPPAAEDSASLGETTQAPAPLRIRAIFEGVHRDLTRFDAQLLDIRLFAGDRYFQFVTIPIPGPMLKRYLQPGNGPTAEELWWHIAVEAKPIIETAIRTGAIPLPDPTDPWEPPMQAVLESAFKRALAEHPSPQAVVGGAVFELAIDSAG
jgi:hypothetical protein